MKIYKFPVPVINRFSITTHAYAKVLSVQVKDGQPMLWMLVDELKPMQQREFLLMATGQTFPEDFSEDCHDFIGTVQVGFYVFHLFDLYFNVEGTRSFKVEV